MNNITQPIVKAYAEKHRPQVHFSPPQNWMNDPNGMVYHDGVYHLFYQYNPFDNVWNDMHWGHASSRDLISWQHHPIAIYPEEEGLGYIFSGCAVVDRSNSSGFGRDGEPPLVAIFTHSSKSGEQVQSLAYSNNAGECWELYADNPVVCNHDAIDFRDPKVFWDERIGAWIMVVAAQSVIQFFRSTNLKEWQHFHDFGDGAGAHDGCWECPDLFRLKIKGVAETKWVLIVSTNPGGPNGGSGTQYFIGDFDGERFQAEHSEVLWMDYGPDNYAGVTWSDQPLEDPRRILIAWMSNWQYANIVPTEAWRGAMTIPRELSLIETSKGLRMACSPIKEFESLRSGAPRLIENLRIDQEVELYSTQGRDMAIDLELSVAQLLSPSDWQIRFHNKDNEELLISISVVNHELQVNRVNSAAGLTEESAFTRIIKAPIVEDDSSMIGLRIIKDASSVEIFSANGCSLFSALYFVNQPLTSISLGVTEEQGAVMLKGARLFELRSVWTD